MSDWQVGDLAMCIYEGDDWRALDKSRSAEPAPLLGCTYTVLHIGVCCDLIGLGLDEFGPRMTFLASRFRKIRPDEQEACEPEFVTLIKRAKRTVSA